MTEQGHRKIEEMTFEDVINNTKMDFDPNRSDLEYVVLSTKANGEFQIFQEGKDPLKFATPYATSVLLFDAFVGYYSDQGWSIGPSVIDSDGDMTFLTRLKEK